MFKELKQKIQDNFKDMSLGYLFYVDIDRDEIWERYLSGFEESLRQEHVCNSCKSFLRQFGGIVSIDASDRKRSIWDGIEVLGFNDSIKNLSKYIHSLPITNIFFNEFAKCGVDKNWDPKNNLTWEHFSILLPNKCVGKDLDSKRANLRDNKEVLKRSLDEIKIDATETVLELIDQNSLYRGKEHEGLLRAFLELQKKYKLVPDKQRDNFVWKSSLQVGDAMCRIKNSSIGTLLIDLSEEVKAGKFLDVDAAVGKFEFKVAGANYKRPNAIVTSKQIETMKKGLEEKGLMDSLSRRYANESDLNINDIIFTDKTTSVQDVFEEMKKNVSVNPKTFGKMDEITISDFIEKIVPQSKSLELLFENNQIGNMVSIITAKDPLSKNLFNWNNPFSWSYTGGITDSMKERVKSAGGSVEGPLRFTIQWNEDGDSICDLDLHAKEPGGNIIYFGNNKTPHPSFLSGSLDVDMIDPRGVGIENVVWTNINKMKDGNYTFLINNYNHGRNTGFKAQVEFNGEIFEFEHKGNFNGDKEIAVVKLTKGVFTIDKKMQGDSTVTSKEKWNLKTNQFHKIKKIMLSPNHWENSGSNTGNKHYFFLLENCLTDENARPFFNEFLRPEFNSDRKAFEVLGGKLKMEATNDQLSGLGFSETQKKSFIVKVEGNFKRLLKVNIGV